MLPTDEQSEIEDVRIARLEGARLAIALCKEEIDRLIPDLEMLDDGSPWGRAFMRFCSINNGTEPKDKD